MKLVDILTPTCTWGQGVRNKKWFSICCIYNSQKVIHLHHLHSHIKVYTTYSKLLRKDKYTFLYFSYNTNSKFLLLFKRIFTQNFYILRDCSTFHSAGRTNTVKLFCPNKCSINCSKYIKHRAVTFVGIRVNDQDLWPIS